MTNDGKKLNFVRYAWILKISADYSEFYNLQIKFKLNSKKEINDLCILRIAFVILAPMTVQQ